MSVLYDVPSNKGLYIKGPVQVRITGWPHNPVIDIPSNIVPSSIEAEEAEAKAGTIGSRTKK